MFHETTLTLYFMKSPERQISQCILPFKELSNPNINKATQNTNIPTKIIKENSDIFGDFIFSNFNCCINTSLYPSLLKRADITPVHKKDSKSENNNYRPVSILSNISKEYERIKEGF